MQPKDFYVFKSENTPTVIHIPLFNMVNCEEAEVPEEVLSKEHTHLEDAGLVMNSPYVAALRPDRKVKLILSFDFSAGDPFMTVTQAAEHCKQTGIPFPPVDISEEDKMQPKDVYVFKSENTPTVIHIPLFNMVNCEGDVAKWRETYPTFRNAYDRETMDELIRVSGLNVANNKNRILQEISDACKKMIQPAKRRHVCLI
ncbi:hypothetical protein SKAU_G00383630 [Synaphobranchus kaupii]|uniref:PLA2c domain-containing protein n=1 Tax=Synaphobranchus kaupii TaxID=118154 RepID=A0A9Q1EE71_SYNKA|nr:hypothetical protein SKAU_G00383630 [Synaphobranchus kaupii]